MLENLCWARGAIWGVCDCDLVKVTWSPKEAYLEFSENDYWKI